MLRREYHPERRLVLFDVKVRFSSECFARVISRLASANIGLLSGVVSGHVHEEFGHLALILDFTEASLQPSEIADELMRSGDAIAVSYAEIPLTVGVAHIVGYTLDDMAAFLRALYAKIGVAAKVLLFHVGIDVGARKADEVLRVSSGREAVERMLLWISGLGWGLPRLVRYVEGKEAVIAVERLFECLSVEGEGSHYFRGFLKGFFDKLWGVETQVIETSCISSGAKECRFLVTAVRRC